jgi:hypothetical protein
MTMNAKLQVLVACCMSVAPDLVQGQRTVVAASEGVLSGDFDYSIGRELLSPNRRLGLRLSLDYARSRVSRYHFMSGISDSGRIVTRPAESESQRRGAGARLALTYAPFRWVVRPYVTVGVGVQDYYSYFRTSAVDSATIDGQTWSALPERTMATSELGPTLEGGLGISSHFGRFGAFVELKGREGYSASGRGGVRIGTTRYPMSFGIRF